MKSNLIYVLKKELREVFRDKKSLMMMLIVPILIPLVVLGMSALFEMQLEMDVTEYNQVGFNYELSEVEVSLAKEMQLEVTFDTQENLQKKLNEGSLDLYVLQEGNHYRLFYDATNENSTLTSRLVQSYFDQYKRILQEQYMAKNNQDSSILDILTVSEEIVGENDFVSNYIVGYAFLFILMAITISATYPATDATAGEKERGTLETLLTFPIRSRDIILGKLFSVTLSSIVTGVISLILAVLSFVISNQMFSVYESVPIEVSAFSIFIVLSKPIIIFTRLYTELSGMPRVAW